MFSFSIFGVFHFLKDYSHFEKIAPKMEVSKNGKKSQLAQLGTGHWRQSLSNCHRWASLIKKLVPLIVGPLLYGLVSITTGPLT